MLASAAVRDPLPTKSSLLEALRERHFLVVTGKGGVGKSVVSAALASVLAAQGRRTLLLEVDPRESLNQFFDVPPSGGEIVPVGARLWLQNLRPQAVLDELTREQIRLGFLARRVIDSPVYRHFTEGAPGLEELAVLGHASRQVGRATPPARPEVVVLDAPATGHGVSLLAAPGLVAQVIHGGPFGHMAKDLAALVADSRRTGVVAVTIAEEMPVQEVVELLAMLRDRIGRSPDAVVVNALYPPVPDEHAADARLESWRARRATNDREWARLRAAWSGPMPALPLLPLDPGPALLAALTDRLAAALAEDLP